MPVVLALIPARGGSKGLPRKNLRQLHGHPLLAYSIAAARQSNHVTRVICSTDDDEIAATAQRYGAETPFVRPASLAEDRTLDLPVFQHALQWLDTHEGWCPELVVQLRPTSPIRFPGEIDRAIEMLLANPHATGVRTVCPAPCNPYKMWRLSSDSDHPDFMSSLLEVPGFAEPYNEPRQALPPVWWQTGQIDATRADIILGGSMTGKRLLPLAVDAKYAVDIDGELGLKVATVLMEGLDCIRPPADLDWSRVRLLAVDVDGTLTPETMYYGPDGEALERLHTHDGQGLAMVTATGIHTAIITGERLEFATARAQQIGVTEVHLGVTDKTAALAGICAKLSLTFSQVAYVGDDRGDLPVISAVSEAGGITCAVADARPEVLAAVRYHCPSKGGYGAVRDVCDQILAAQPARH